MNFTLYFEGLYYKDYLKLLLNFMNQEEHHGKEKWLNKVSGGGLKFRLNSF